MSEKPTTETPKSGAADPPDPLEPFESFMEFLQETDEFMSLVRNSIGTMIAVGELGEARRKHQAEMYRHIKKISSQEVEADFPLLHALCIVALWSALEATLPTFIARFACVYPDVMTRPEWERIRVPLGTYHAMSDEDRMNYATEQLFQTVQYGNQPGVGRFEAVLNAIGLGGPVSDETRNSMHEMYQIRNVIVHKFSIADERFVRMCPKLNQKAGEKIKISYESYLKYRNALGEYARTVLRRVADQDWREDKPVSRTRKPYASKKKTDTN